MLEGTESDSEDALEEEENPQELNYPNKISSMNETNNSSAFGVSNKMPQIASSVKERKDM